MPDVNETNVAAGASAEEKPLTRAEVQEMLTKGLNGAITGHLKRLDLSGQIMKAMEPFKALLPVKTEETEEVVEEGDKAKPAPQRTDAQVRAAAASNPEMDAMRKEIESNKRKMAELVSKQRDAETKALASERKRVEEGAYSTLRASLSGKVLPGYEADVADLFRARNQVLVTEAGEVRFRLSVNDPEEGISMDDGLAAWRASPHAKAFIPAPTTAPALKRPVAPIVPGRAPAPPKPASAIEAFEAKTGQSVDSLI